MRFVVAFCLLAGSALPVFADDIPKPTRRLQVLYVEGYPRWEYRWHRNLLERPLDGKQPFIPRVFLADAEKGWAETDALAVTEFPRRALLTDYDVVILGDLDPKQLAQPERALKDLAEFVTVRGGGLVLIAGSHHGPHAFKETPLEDLLPIELGAKPGKQEALTEGYRLRPAAVGLKHPAFQFGGNPDERRTALENLPAMYWWAGGYKARAGAEVLAVHPVDPHPLLLVRAAGKGKVAFVGFDESWRWRRNEGMEHYQTFWANLWRSVAPE